MSVVLTPQDLFNNPDSLYFTGFTLGGLKLGAVGFLASPPVIALLLENIEILNDKETNT